MSKMKNGWIDGIYWKDGVIQITDDELQELLIPDWYKHYFMR